MNVRFYNSQTDYDQLKQLYLDSSTFGGKFSEERNSVDKISQLVSQKEDAVLVAEEEGEIIGSVTLFEDGRAAWLYRFAVFQDHKEAEELLFEKASQILRQKGHKEVLVYAPQGDQMFKQRYINLGFSEGSNYTSYYKNLK